MKVEITIQCETEDEIVKHLKQISRRIKLETFKDGGIAEPLEFQDGNCYGDHTVKVNPDE